jgi:hypothetical protein
VQSIDLKGKALFAAHRGLLFLSLLIIGDKEGETCHSYVIASQRVEGFWGLTCDFWAENGKRKMQKAKIKAINQSPSALLGASGLRSWQNAGAFRRVV